MQRSSRILVFALALMVSFSLVFAVSTENASAATKKPVSYSYVKLDKTKTYPEGTINVFYKYIEIKGSTKGINNVNSALVKSAKSYVKKNDPDTVLYPLLKNYQYDDDFIATCSLSTKYNKKGYISLEKTEKWFAGGVFNINVTGVTYNVNTGKKVKIAKVLPSKYNTNKKKGRSNFRKVVYNKIKKKYGKEFANNFKSRYKSSKKLKNINFYVGKKGTVIVCFPTYDIGYGYNGSMSVKVAGRLK